MPDNNLPKKIERLKPEKISLPQEGKESLKNIPEKGLEKKSVEQAERQAQQEMIKEQLGQSTQGIATVASIRKHREERKKEIENVLADGLGDVFLNMAPAEQARFKTGGEATAEEINTLMDKAKVKIKKVISLIKKWLILIPGINKVFLEQEAKIKADKIMKIKNDKIFD